MEEVASGGRRVASTFGVIFVILALAVLLVACTNAPRVAVVDEQFAKHYWPGGNPVGKHIRLESRAGTPVEIVGITQTIKYQGSVEKPMDFVYMPLA